MKGFLILPVMFILLFGTPTFANPYEEFLLLSEPSYELTSKGAEQGDAYSQYRLGWMYLYGNGVPQDYKAAFK